MSLAAGVVHAQDVRLLPAAEARSLQQRFEKRQAALRSAAVEFSQSLRLPGMRNPALSRGRIAYAAPGRLRVEYELPAGELLLLPGDGTLVTRKPGRAPVLRKLERLDERTQRSLLLLLSLFEGRLPPGFADARVAAQRVGDDRVVLKLSRAGDAAEGGDGESIETTLTWPALDVSIVSVQVANGVAIKYEFSRLERNANLPVDTFAPPASP